MRRFLMSPGLPGRDHCRAHVDRDAAAVMPDEWPRDLEAAARRALMDDTIDAEEFARAIDHIAAGGRGCEEFPYLPVFTAGRMERISA